MQLNLEQKKLLRWVEAKQPVLGIFHVMTDLRPMIDKGLKSAGCRCEGTTPDHRGGEKRIGCPELARQLRSRRCIFCKHQFSRKPASPAALGERETKDTYMPQSTALAERFVISRPVDTSDD